MSTNEGTKYRAVSRSCMIIGTLIGAVIAFLFTLLIGAFHGFGIVLFLALTWVIGMVLARYCARTDDGDIFGIGKTLGLHKAEREGRLSGDHISQKLRRNAADSSQSRKITETKEDIKTAAVETKEEIKAAAQEIVEDTKSALTSKSEGDPADVPTAGAPPAPGRGPTSGTGASGALDDGGRDPSGSAEGPGGAVTPAPHPVMPTGAATPADPGQEDDLQRISGIGPQAAARLKELGVTRFDQIAGWSDEDIDRMESQLGGVSGRIRRDDWVGQAKVHAAASQS